MTPSPILPLFFVIVIDIQQEGLNTIVPRHVDMIMAVNGWHDASWRLKYEHKLLENATTPILPTENTKW